MHLDSRKIMPYHYGMAKRPKRLTPLRQVRIATKLSQRKFAKLLRLNYHQLESLELGRAKMKREYAERIHQATGALPDSIDHELSSCAMYFSNVAEPYCEQSWHHWNTSGKASIEREAANFAQDLIGWTQFLCLVANQNRKFWDLHHQLAKALSDCATQCGLNMEKALSHELRFDRKLLSFTYGELRGNPTLAQAVGFRDTTYVKGRITTNDDVWRCSVRLADITHWDPSSAMPMSLLNKLARTFPWHKSGPCFPKGRL